MPWYSASSAVDAAWASWGYWTSCTKSCDGGVRTYIGVQTPITLDTDDGCFNFQMFKLAQKRWLLRPGTYYFFVLVVVFIWDDNFSCSRHAWGPDIATQLSTVAARPSVPGPEKKTKLAISIIAVWEGSCYQIGWFFGKIPNGLWPPPFLENYVAIFF